MFHGYGFFGIVVERALEKDRRRDGAEPASRRPPKGHGLFWPELLLLLSESADSIIFILFAKHII